MAGNREAYQAAMQAGHAQARERNWAGAANEYRRAISEFPNDIAAHTSLAMVWYRMGSLAQCLAELEFVHQLAPGDTRVANKIAEIRQALNAPAAARIGDPSGGGTGRAGTNGASGTVAEVAAGPRRQEALLSALAARRSRGEGGSGNGTGLHPEGLRLVPEAPRALGVPGLIAQTLYASTQPERQAAYQELVAHLIEDPQASDVEQPGRPRVEQAARFAVLSLARLRAVQRSGRGSTIPARTDALAPSGALGHLAELGLDPDVSLHDLDDLPEPGQVRAMVALARSRILLDEGRALAAVDECQAGIEQAPGFLPLHLRLAEALQQQGRTAAALTLFSSVVDVYGVRESPVRALAALRRAVQISPDNQPLRAKLARALLDQGFTEEALAHHLAICEHYLAIGQTDKAFEEYRRTLSIFPDSAEALIEFGRALSRLGRTVDAAETFIRAWSVDTANPLAAAYCLTANASEPWEELRPTLEALIEAASTADGRLSAALRVLDDAAELYPENAALTCAAGTVLVAAGHPERAIRFLEATVASGQPPATDAQPFLARAMLAVGRADAALEALGHADLSDDDPDALMLRAEAYLQRGQWSEAEPLLEKVAELVGEPAVRWQQALVNAHLGRIEVAFDQIETAEPDDASEVLQNAVAALEAAIAETPTPWTWHRRLAAWHRGRNANRRAALALALAGEAQAAAEGPAAAIGPFSEAIALVRGTDLEVALQLRQRLAKVAPTMPGVRQSLISTYMNMGRATEALEEALRYASELRAAEDWSGAATMLRQVLQLDPWHREALLDLGIALVHLDQRAEAERTFERLIRLDPENQAAQEQLRRVRDAGGA